MQAFLRKSLIVSGLVLASAVIGQNANADSGDTVHWKSIIGIIQANSVVGTGTGAVTGAPGPWSSLDGSVSVDLDGESSISMSAALCLPRGTPSGLRARRCGSRAPWFATPTAARAGIPSSWTRRSWTSMTKAMLASTATSARCRRCARQKPISPF